MASRGCLENIACTAALAPPGIVICVTEILPDTEVLASIWVVTIYTVRTYDTLPLLLSDMYTS